MSATRPTITVLTGLAILVVAAAPATAAVADGDASVTTAAPSDGTGPPADLPGPVPGFVEEILSAVREFVVGLTAGESATGRPAVAGGG